MYKEYLLLYIMSYGSIYKIQFPNGKHYIGLTTTSIEQRTKEHRYSAKCENTQYIYKALRKHDMVDTFELIEIDTAETKEELCELEIAYIQMYNSYYKDDCGYNMTFGGEGFNGYVHTEDVKQKMSEARKKHFIENPNAGKDQGKSLKKYYKDNPIARKKQSEAQKKRYQDNPEAAKEQIERLKEYWKTTESRQKMSEIKKKFHKENPESIQKSSERQKKHFIENPELRQKCSERAKKRFECQDERKKLSDGKGKNKPFDIFTIDGIFIKTFCYQFEAREYLQKEHNITSHIRISEVLAGKRNNSAGFIFTYK